MDDKLPKLIDVYKNNEDMSETMLSIIIFRQCGYSWDDFQEFVDEAMNDEEFKQVIEAITPMFEYALREVKRSVK